MRWYQTTKKHNNISVIDGAGVKNILGTKERVLVGCKFWGVQIKNAAVKLIVLDSNIDYNIVGESTGVDMHANEVW